MAQPETLIDRLASVPPNLKIGREIDRGAWGAVYEGELDGQPVAVKKVHQLLRDAENGDKVLLNFCEECERLKTMDYLHVIKFSGAFKDAELGPILVMERMKENLRQFLERHKDDLCIKDQIRISHEITKGVAFLHQLDPPMVHRDLNDKNVMFSFEGVAKIGDFGQSKLKQDLYLTSDQPGMVSFMPPEALGDGTSKYDESLDIFSLGVLMLEIGTQRHPLCSIVGIGTISEIKRREKDLQKMSDAHPFKPVIVLCLSDNRKQRPKAAEMLIVLSRLEVDILQTVLAAEQRFSKMEASCATLQQDCTALKEDLRVALDESEARKQLEQILVQQLNERLTLDARLETLSEELASQKEAAASEKLAKHELAEISVQLQIQLKAMEDDFNAERRDMETARAEFADKEKKWIDQLATLSQEHDGLTVDILMLKDQLDTVRETVPFVANTDQDNADSDEEYKSLEHPAAITSASATVEERHHQQHHESELQKSVLGSSDQVICRIATVDRNVEELQVRLVELEAEKDATEQEQQRLAGEERNLQAEAKNGTDMEGRVASLSRQCDALSAKNESLPGLLSEQSQQSFMSWLKDKTGLS